MRTASRAALYVFPVPGGPANTFMIAGKTDTPTSDSFKSECGRGAWKSLPSMKAGRSAKPLLSDER